MQNVAIFMGQPECVSWHPRLRTGGICWSEVLADDSWYIWM